jgi:hypothetical protein
VQVEVAVRRQRLLDREPRELVPERDRARGGREHSGGEALLEPVDRVAGERCEEPELGLRGDDCDGVEQRACVRAQPRRAREHRVPDRGRNLVARRRERLGHEERVARRLAVQLVGVDPQRLCERRHGRGRQRRHGQTADLRSTRELTEHHSEGMPALELVVAVRGQDERGHGRNPPREEPQDVERRLVRGVHVLDDEDRRRARLELANERCRDLVRPRSRPCELLQLAARVLGDVEERPEGTRCEERVARAPKEPDALRTELAEASDERSLADAGLSPDEQDASARAPADALQRVAEDRHLGGALE